MPSPGASLIDNHPILGPARLYFNQQKHVELDETALRYLSFELAETYSLPPVRALHWLSAAPAQVQQYITRKSLYEAVEFLAIFHALGFCYWTEPRWTYASYGTTYNGSLALLHSLRENIDRLKELYQKPGAKPSDLALALSGHNSLALMERRFANFMELMQALSEGFGDELLKKEKALTKAYKIKERLPGYQDKSKTTLASGETIEINFLKRAQLLVSDIDYMMRFKKIEGLAQIDGLEQMEELTAFADYKLPQVLRDWGVFNYSKELTDLLDKKTVLAQDSPEEIAIRCATLVAVEKLKEALTRLLTGTKLKSSEVDNLLWLKSQKEANDKTRPYHRCLTDRY